MTAKEFIKSKPFIFKVLLSSYRKAKKVIYDVKGLLLILRIISIKLFDHKRVFWLITPTHGNLGDQAIAKAERIMLEKNKIRFLEITGDRMFDLMDKKMLRIFNGNPILMHGGGYLGTLWFNDEILVRNILKANPDSKILFFPNTLYFESDEKGQKELALSNKIYNAHKHTKFYAREKQSFQLFNDMGVKVGLAPDIVMSLKEDRSSDKRSGCMMLLRSDCEKTRSEEMDRQIGESAKKIFGNNIKWSDTVVPYRITIKRRNAELERFFNELRSSELIITDRLHGMIMAAITGTPCIVLNSKSPKVMGCYEWIRDLDYIKICEDPLTIPELYSQMPHGDQHYDNSKLVKKYQDLVKDIRSFVK